MTPELEERIAERLETMSLRQICSRFDDVPDRATIHRHMAANPEFATKCARAREENAEFMDDRILEIAQKVESGELEPKAGSVIISAFQWRASKLAPKKYGDKLQQEVTGADGGPIQAAITVTFVEPNVTE
jgi:hypothetical protein